MSKALDWAFNAVKGSDLSSSARVVLLTVAKHADFSSGYNARPSINTIASITGLSRSTVSRALLELEADGLLIRAGRHHRMVTVWHLSMMVLLIATCVTVTYVAFIGGSTIKYPETVATCVVVTHNHYEQQIGVVSGEGAWL